MDLLKRFWYEEDGVGGVEIILIIVVLIGVVILFKKEIRALVESIFKTINKDAKSV